MKGRSSFSGLFRACVFLLFISALACTPASVEGPGNPGGESDEPSFDYQGDYGEMTEVRYTNERGRECAISAYPGLVFLCYEKGVPVKTVETEVVAASGTIVAQKPAYGYYTVSVGAGQENSFIQTIRTSPKLVTAYPLIEIRPDAAFFVDRGEHATDVNYQMTKGKNGLQTHLVDIAALLAEKATIFGKRKNPTLDELGDLLLEALSHGDCEVVNISQGPKYGDQSDLDRLDAEKEKPLAERDNALIRELEKKTTWGASEELNQGYIDMRAKWINIVCDAIRKSGRDNVPVILSSGNDSCPELDKVIAGVDEKNSSMLGSQVFVISAEQHNMLGGLETYPNRVQNRTHKAQVVNIDGIASRVAGHGLLMGTSFAAPNFVRYLYLLVEASKESDEPLTYMSAAKLLSDKWMELGISAWTDEEISKLIAPYSQYVLEFEGVPESANPGGGTYKLHIDVYDTSYRPIDWELVTNCDWIHFEKASGQGSATVKMLVDGNGGNQVRQGYVRLKVAGSKDDDVLKNVTANILQGYANIAPEFDANYPFVVLPGNYDKKDKQLYAPAGSYDENWCCDMTGFDICFKSNYPVQGCYLADADGLEYYFSTYYGIYPDSNGIYENDVTVYVRHKLPIYEDCGYRGIYAGYRPSSAVKSKRVELYVATPGGGGIYLTDILVVGLPSIRMTKYRLSDVTTPYDVDMEGHFSLEFEVDFADEITKSVCNGIGFFWKSKEQYYIENKTFDFAAAGKDGTFIVPLDQKTIELEFMQYPLETRTFNWYVDMFVRTYGPYNTDYGTEYSYVNASASGTISHTF